MSHTIRHINNFVKGGNYRRWRQRKWCKLETSTSGI